MFSENQTIAKSVQTTTMPHVEVPLHNITLFHTESVEPGISQLKLRFPPPPKADFCHILVLLSHPKSILKITILYETLHI